MKQIGFQLYDASGIPFIRIGQFPDNTIALKISQPGIDVTKALPTQLVFNSNIISGVYTFPTTPSINGSSGTYQTTQVIPHNLGYVPAFLVYAQIPNGIPNLPGFPTLYYTQVVGLINMTDIATAFVSTTIAVGIDDKNLYINRLSSNSDTSPHTGSEIALTYYILEYGAVAF